MLAATRSGRHLCLNLCASLSPTTVTQTQIVYKIKWKGYTEQTWEPLSNIIVNNDTALYDDWQQQRIPTR